MPQAQVHWMETNPSGRDHIKGFQRLQNDITSISSKVAHLLYMLERGARSNQTPQPPR